METQNDTDRRATLNARIEYRDELLELAIEAVAGRLDLRRTVDLHCDLNVFIDGNEARFPGVVSRLRTALREIGWTYAMGAEALTAYNASMLEARKPGSTCGKCSGRGRLDYVAHIEGGICFSCGGTGKVRS